MLLPFWYRLTQVVSDKGLLNRCMHMYILNYMKHSASVIIHNAVVVSFSIVIIAGRRARLVQEGIETIPR